MLELQRQIFPFSSRTKIGYFFKDIVGISKYLHGMAKLSLSFETFELEPFEMNYLGSLTSYLKMGPNEVLTPKICL